MQSLLLSTWSSLGLIGLTMFVLAIFAIFYHWYRESIRRSKGSLLTAFRFSAVFSYSQMVGLLLVISLSAVATHFSWSVLWFSLGFFSRVFSFEAESVIK